MKTRLARLAVMAATAALTGGCTLFDFSREEPEEVTYTTFVSCDVRLVRVSDAKVVSSASSREEADDLDDLADDLADDLEGNKAEQGKAVAVTTLRSLTDTDQCRQLTAELREKITGELTDASYFVICERQQLRAILDEKDLQSSSVVKDPKVQKELAGVDYLLFGVVRVHKEKD